MSKIIFITPPAQGHFNPVLPVMRELVQRGERVICCNNEEFRPQIEKTGAEFRAYPPSILTSAAISEALADGNLSKPHLLMLQSAAVLTPFTLEMIRPRYTENAKRIQKLLQETGGFRQAANAIQTYMNGSMKSQRMSL